MKFRTKAILPALAALALSGCASTQITPPTTPTPVQVAAVDTGLVSTGLSPASYVNDAATLIAQNCDDYFTSLINSSQQTNLASSLVTLGAGAATGAAAAAGAGPLAIAIPGMASALFTGGVSAYQQSMAAGADPTAVYSVIDRAIQTQLAAMPPPITIEDAGAEAQALASNCRLPKIREFVNAAIMTAPVMAAPVVSPNVMARAEIYGTRRVQIPVVTVGR